MPPSLLGQDLCYPFPGAPAEMQLFYLFSWLWLLPLPQPQYMTPTAPFSLPNLVAQFATQVPHSRHLRGLSDDAVGLPTDLTPGITDRHMLLGSRFVSQGRDLPAPFQLRRRQTRMRREAGSTGDTHDDAECFRSQEDLALSHVWLLLCT